MKARCTPNESRGGARGAEFFLQRETLHALARLMLPTLEEEAPNLLMPNKDLQVLLAEGAHLLGAGLLDLVKSDCRTLLTPRLSDLWEPCWPRALIEDATPTRCLCLRIPSLPGGTWLRLGSQGERGDLPG